MASNPMGTCPLGGLWYTCTAQNPTFLGCCTSNPCNGVGCPASDLRAAGMGTASGPDPGVTNDGSYWPNVKCSVGQWWTCASQVPSFQGCCESNPCGGAGCPAGKLHAAAFSTVTALTASTSRTSLSSTRTSSTNPTTLYKVSSTGGPLVTDNPSTSQQMYTTTLSHGVPSTATVVIVQTAAAAGNSTVATAATFSSRNIAALAGGIAGGIMLLLILAFAAWWTCKGRKQRSYARSASAFEPWRGPPGEPVRSHAVEKGSTVTMVDAHESYYATQPTFKGTTPHKENYSSNVNLISPPVTPGPPAYQSPSPNPTINVHEIDSRNIHEINSGDASNAPRAWELDAGNHDGGGYGSVVAELPVLEGPSRCSARSPVALGLSGRGRRDTGDAQRRLGEVSSQSLTVGGGNESENINNRNRGSGGSGVSSITNQSRVSYSTWDDYDR